MVLHDLEQYGSKLLDRVDRLGDSEARALYATIVHSLLHECAGDGLAFLRFVVTRDEADPEHSLKPFPVHLDYIRDLWGIVDRSPRVVIAKSRQMLVSWLVAAFCCWWARFKPHQAIYWQTQQWKDAVAMTCAAEGGFEGRCQFIETHLPEWLKVPFKASEGCLSYANGSLIQALPGGADQIRGKVASVIVEDEFARQDEATGVYTAIAPLVQKGARLIVVSTPNGSANQFAVLYHGRVMDRA